MSRPRVLLLLAGTAVAGQAALVWQVGTSDDAWPVNLTGGGPNTAFVSEQGVINPLPGSATNVPTVPVSASADNDYYFAGTYTSTIPSAVALYGAYTPVGIIAANEEAAERAHAASDLELRYHFNLPTTLASNHTLSITWEALNLGTDVSNPRFGNELYFNGILVQPEIIVRPADVVNPGTPYTTARFTLASVNAQTGPGADNIVSLKGISYALDGGSNWMGLDYIRLDSQIPEPSSTILIALCAMALTPSLRRRRP